MCRENLIDFSCYDVYEDGRLWSKHWNRWFDGTINEDGYIRVSVKCIDGAFRGFLFHRLIYFYFKGEIPENMTVNHIDENKLNNAITNLNLLTQEGNCNWGTRNERISNAHKGRKKGSPSEETRRKLSEAQKMRMAKEEEKEKYYKPIWVYKDNELVGVYKSVKEASEQTHFSRGNISAASRGVHNREGNHKIGEYMFYNESQI